jgi:flagellar biosynthetic protein FliS
MGTLIGELRGRLDLQAGGTLAAHFEDLYDYMGRRLTAARLEGDAEILAEVCDLLREVRLAWSAIPPSACAQRVPAPAIKDTAPATNRSS